MATYYSPKVITDGLVFCMDAANQKSYIGSGTTWNDISGNSAVGTLTNGPTFSGTNGGSIVFDGTNDYVDIPQTSALQITDKISLEAWIYPTKNSGTQNVICKSSNSQNTGYIYPRTDNGWASSVFYLNIGGWKTLSANWPGLNAWYHTVGVYDGARMYIYINNFMWASVIQSGTISTNSNSLTLGTQPGFTEYFGGNIAVAKVYNRALSAAEIANNYFATKAKFGLI